VDENFGLVEVSRGLRYKVKAQSGLYDGGLLVVRNGVNDDGSWVRGLVTLLICRWRVGLLSGLECLEAPIRNPPDWTNKNTSTRLNLKYSISAHPLDT
jgi:hypothetical protein